jgi:hypothetical protein
MKLRQIFVALVGLLFLVEGAVADTKKSNGDHAPKKSSSTQKSGIKEIVSGSELSKKLCSNESVAAIQDFTRAYGEAFPEGRVAHYEDLKTVLTGWGKSAADSSFSHFQNIGVRDIGVYRSPDLGNFLLFARDAKGAATEVRVEKNGLIHVRANSKDVCSLQVLKQAPASEGAVEKVGSALGAVASKAHDLYKTATAPASGPVCQCRVKPEISLTQTSVQVTCQVPSDTCQCYFQKAAAFSKNTSNYLLVAQCGKEIKREAIPGSVDPLRDTILKN